MQLAHAGRKASSQVPWRGGKQIEPDQPGGWTALAAVTSGIGLLGGPDGVKGQDGFRRGVIAAVASYFGVADLRAFATGVLGAR